MATPGVRPLVRGAEKPAAAGRMANDGERDFIRLCTLTTAQALEELGTGWAGLSAEEAEHRLAQVGPNELSQRRKLTLLQDLWQRLRSPLVVQLLVIATVSAFIGEAKSAVIVSAMVLLSVGLSFVLDRRSNQAVENLGKRVQSRTTVIRDGVEQEVRISAVVPGDIVVLHAGSIIPADVRLLAAKDFFVSESALTGESLPVEKTAQLPSQPPAQSLELTNACFFGTWVTSGTAQALVLRTGEQTLFGALSQRLAQQRPETDFDQGVRSFTWLMMRTMVVMVALVFLIVGLTKQNWVEALLFGLSVSVGLTPEMLPMMLTANLAKGALSMARKKVIVKRLPAIQNLGAVDVLCTDKTGTLTQDRVVLEKHVDILGNPSEAVLNYAYLNSMFQTGLRNLIDRAILEYADLDTSQCRLVDELPFDFQRRRMSVVVEYEGDH
ncbi:MAG: HAD-IC family P-type ATPase, partial [Thermoanaerobaculum sp.]|nr:HAD-IC family P-type ATPase [Thermoanaerobaculum sp.]